MILTFNYFLKNYILFFQQHNFLINEFKKVKLD